MIMGVCHCTALELSMMQDQKLLTLRWYSFLGGGSDMVVGPFAYKGGPYYHYGLMLSRRRLIFQDARLGICDALLTLIPWMRQEACCLLFNIYSRPITPRSIDMPMHAVDCRKDQTNIVDAPLTIHWCSPWRHTNSHLVRNHSACKSYCPYEQTISRFWVESFVYKSIEVFQFLRHHYSCHQSDQWRSSVVFWHIHPVGYGVHIHKLILDI